MTRIDQNTAVVAQAQSSAASSGGSGVLIPFNAPASTSFDQVMQSIGANSSSSNDASASSAPASSLTPLTPPVLSTSTSAMAGGSATMGAGSTTGTLGSTSPSMNMGSTSPSMNMGMGVSMPAAVPGASSSSGLSALSAGLRTR